MIETFITVHDQDILIECEASGQFSDVSRTYLFVGPRPVDRITKDLKVIVARDYDPNFERWPSFYDFTGWYVLAKHGLIEADDIITVQYDMEITNPDIAYECEHLLETATGPVAFTAGHNLAGNFMLMIKGFPTNYRRGLERLCEPDMDSWPEFNEWPSTQGMAWRTEEFTDFMLWIEPLFELWHDDLWAGHLMERTVKAWCVITGHTEQYLGGMINHLHGDVHGTCALMAGQVDVYNRKAQTFGI